MHLVCSHATLVPHSQAILTKKSGVDKRLLDLMRPLLDAGLGPHCVHALLLELRSKDYFEKHIGFEEELGFKLQTGISINKEVMCESPT